MKVKMCQEAVVMMVINVSMFVENKMFVQSNVYVNMTSSWPDVCILTRF